MRVTSYVMGLCLLATAAVAQVDPLATERKEAGNHYLKNRQYEQARDQYLAALQREPDYADAHYNLGVVYFFRLKDHARALYHLSRYAQLKPDAADLGQVRALLSQALERIEAAERATYAETLAGAADVAALEAFIADHPGSYYAADAERKVILIEEFEKERQRLLQATADAYQRALARATPEAMDEFIANYPHAPQLDSARELRRTWAEQRQVQEQDFLAATRENTPVALQSFLDRHPDSPYAQEARNRLERLQAAATAYAQAADTRSVAALEAFLQTHPESAQAAQAKQLIETLQQEDAAYQEATRQRTTSAVEAFLAAHPDSTHRREAELLLSTLQHEASLRAQQQLEQGAETAFAAALASGTIPALEAFVQEHPDSPRVPEAHARIEALHQQQAAEQQRATEHATAAADAAYQAAVDAGTAEALRRFLAAHPDHHRAGEAERLLAELDAAESAAAQRAREAADVWSAAVAEDSAAGYERFYQDHPEHPQAEEARRRAAAMRPAPPPREQADPTARREQAWQRAQEDDSAASYRRFLEQHPQGEEADAARNRLQELEADAGSENSPGNLSRSKKRALERYRRMLLDQ